METACSYGSKAAAYSSPTAEDVSLEVIMEGDGPRMGEDAELTIRLRNVSSEPRTVTLHSQLAVMYYTGVHKDTVKKDKVDEEILPNEGEQLGLLTNGLTKVFFELFHIFAHCNQKFKFI